MTASAPHRVEIGHHRLPGAPLSEMFLTEDPAASDVFLVRHGQQRAAPARAERSDFLDPRLSSLGERQAAAVAAELSSARLGAVFVSGLQRAQQTGEAIAGPHGLTVQVVPELREVDVYRDLESVSDTIAPSEPWRRGIAAEFVRTGQWDAFPYGESSAELRRRVTTSINGALTMVPGGTNVAVVCHGGVINAYLAELLQVRADLLFQPAHSSVTRLRWRGDRRAVHTLNAVHHLAGELLSY